LVGARTSIGKRFKAGKIGDVADIVDALQKRTPAFICLLAGKISAN